MTAGSAWPEPKGHEDPSEGNSAAGPGLLGHHEVAAVGGLDDGKAKVREVQISLPCNGAIPSRGLRAALDDVPGDAAVIKADLANARPVLASAGLKRVRSESCARLGFFQAGRAPRSNRRLGLLPRQLPRGPVPAGTLPGAAPPE